MLWLLIILNQAGGEPGQVYFESELLCEAAADEIDAMPYVSATCIYMGNEDID